MMAQMTSKGTRGGTQHDAGHANEVVSLSTEHNEEMLRIIQQYLTQQGYAQVAESLAAASNVPMEDPVVSTFRR